MDAVGSAYILFGEWTFHKMMAAIITPISKRLLNMVSSMMERTNVTYCLRRRLWDEWTLPINQNSVLCVLKVVLWHDDDQHAARGRVSVWHASSWPWLTSLLVAESLLESSIGSGGGPCSWSVDRKKGIAIYVRLAWRSLCRRTMNDQGTQYVQTQTNTTDNQDQFRRIDDFRMDKSFDWLQENGQS